MTPEARRVEALLSMGRADEAASLAETLPEREAPTPGFLRLRGRALRAAGRLFDAEGSFREALALSPGEAGLLADLATTLLGQKRHREALSFAREAMSVRPDVAAFHALVGVLAEALGLDEEAGRELAAARALSPGDAESHVVYGFHALRQGRVAEAEGVFRDALRADAQRSEAHHGLARALAEQKQLDAARVAWADALALDPTLIDLRLQRALDPVAPGDWRHTLASMPHWLSVGLGVGGSFLLLTLPLLALPAWLLALSGPTTRAWLDWKEK